VVDEVAALKALAHPVRLGIVGRLAAEPEICACDFTEVFAVSQPTISAHLKALREAGVVQTRRDGTTICYSLVPETVAALRDLLATLCQDVLSARASRRPSPGTARPGSRLEPARKRNG
jgi:ArsR family transcriptional regulator, arsenate/arsenite/antimonite-responsive transcriptional repressor